MMPDLEPEADLVDLSFSRPAVNDALPPHDFVPSEFDPTCGRCDRCGGGPGAAIHQAPVDQMARIADALERIAVAMEYAGERSALALERIAVREKGPFYKL